MPDTPAPFGRYFLPGPVEVRPDLLAVMLRPMITHRGPEMAALLRRMQPQLQALFRTKRPVLMATSSATGLMEAAVRGGVEHRVLVAVGGYFGERFARVAEACGKEVIRVMVPEGRSLGADQLERFLDGPEVDAVALVHSETSTGALAPLEALASVVRKQRDVMLLVDAVTSVGGSPVETDAWDLDFVFTGTQKALGLPPGLALGVASERFMERAAARPERGWYLDALQLDEAARTDRPIQTPSLPLVFALAHQLDRIESNGGVTARWEAHRRMQAIVEQWADAHAECTLLAPHGHRSSTVSAVRLPAGRSAQDVVAAMAGRGWSVATGLPPLEDTVIRMGHMGDADSGALGAMLQDLGKVVGQV